MQLDEQDGTQLVKLARHTLEDYLSNNSKINVDPAIKNKYGQKSGVFVTLNSLSNNSEELRGCVGFPMPDKALYDAVVHAAISSATGDPRFQPVTKDELNNITIELSILTQPELISVTDPRQYKEKIEVGRDGLIIHWKYGSGLLLPQVPVEHEWDEERFLCETCVKAGTMPDCWFYEDTKIYKFEALIFKEVKPKGQVVIIPLVKK